MTGRSRLQFKINGMDCAEEVAILKRAVGPVVGGEDKLAFDILNAKMTVTAWDGLPSEDAGTAAGRTGMRAEPWPHEPDAAEEDSLWIRHGRTLTTAMSGVLLALGYNALDVNQERLDYVRSRQLQPAEKASQVTLAAYRLGAAPPMDYREAQRRYRDTIRVYNRAPFDERVSRFALNAGVGQGEIQ